MTAVVAIIVLFWVVKKGRKSPLDLELEAFAELSWREEVDWGWRVL